MEEGEGKEGERREVWPLVTAWYQGLPSSPGAPSASSQESVVGLPAEEPQTNCPPRGWGLREEAQAARPLPHPGDLAGPGH